MENKNTEFARFMGYKTGEELGKERWKKYWFHPDGSNYEYLHFDDNWNLLMQVVDKIEKEVGLIEFHPHKCIIVDRKWKNRFESEGGPKIDCVYDACFMYINWFNKTDFEKRFNLAKTQIGTDILNRIVPEKIKSFADLHEYVDANCYGGISDEDYEISENFVFENELQESLDKWIKNGRK